MIIIKRKLWTQNPEVVNPKPISQNVGDAVRHQGPGWTSHVDPDSSCKYWCVPGPGQCRFTERKRERERERERARAREREGERKRESLRREWRKSLYKERARVRMREYWRVPPAVRLRASAGESCFAEKARRFTWVPRL